MWSTQSTVPLRHDPPPPGFATPDRAIFELQSRNSADAAPLLPYLGHSLDNEMQKTDRQVSHLEYLKEQAKVQRRIAEEVHAC